MQSVLNRVSSVSEKMGLYFLYQLTVSALLLCTTPAGGYVVQTLLDCEYSDNMTDMVFLMKNIFNQKISTLYDSRVGKYVGFGELGMKSAAHLNSDVLKMEERKRQVDTFCRHDARAIRKSTLYRTVPPTVEVHQTNPVGYGELSMLECSVLGFFPQEVRVTWLRDGAEVTTDVSSTDVLPNGDWTFQLHSYLEFTPRRGERVTCRVEHKSLRESLDMDWDTSALDAKYWKKAVGITFFFIGITAAAGGAVYYWWKRRSGFSTLGTHVSYRGYQKAVLAIIK